MSANNAKFPKDAQVIIAILQELGIEDFDPKVINQLLEFVYWHTTVILDDARVFSNHAKKKNIDVNDVKLAIQMHAEKMTSSGPPRDVLLEMARTKNSTSLAPIKPQSGIRLPPDRYCLIQTNYRMKSNSGNVFSTGLKSSTSISNGNVNTPSSSHSNQEMKFISSPSLKQMPTIASRTSSSSPSYVTKNVSSDGFSAGRGVTNVSMSPSIIQTEIKEEFKPEIFEVDALSDHI